KPGGLIKLDGTTGRVYVRKRVKGAFDENGKLNADWARKTLKKHNDNVAKISKKPSDPFDDEDEV
ncbi:hypothetical protein KU309_23850, partial [Salmonella enterica subsp. enterica serovar Mbandaka]|nr:hypothetical protein [Salmonella enterica subsp. enterica serovar Mbandaka]